MREERTEVLVVGAGPVGLLAALAMAEAGLEVRIVDREERTATRSYACALHPRTMGLLDRLGLAEELIERGRRVETVAFYDGPQRRAQLRLDQAGGRFPFLLILPQNLLEETLEERLRRKTGLGVGWNHRFEACEAEDQAVSVTVQELGGTSTGYIVPHWETVVVRQLCVRARFLVGADGYNSLVRQRLGMDYRHLAGPTYFAAYEFEGDAPAENEVRVVLDQGTTNVLWPLAGNRGRWTFQLVKSEILPEFPEKERRAVHLERKTVDENLRQYVQRVGSQRAPWFSTRVQQVTWCTNVVFEQRLARRFGQDRCWLAGDAAHQTGPVGAQSMNVGLCEAQALAGRLQRILRQDGPLDLLDDYERQCQAEWGRLLGLSGGLKARTTTGDWVRGRLPRLLSCLPGSGDDLAGLANQLDVDV